MQYACLGSVPLIYIMAWYYEISRTGTNIVTYCVNVYVFHVLGL